MRLRLKAGGIVLLSINLLLLAGQAGFGKQAAVCQVGMGIYLFFLNPYYLAMMTCLILQALIWPLILNRVPLGFAYGINSLSFVNTLAISHWLFGESVTGFNLAGAGLIVIGLWIWASGLEPGA